MRLALTAPARLHFGLWSLASAAGRQFGGVGVMVDDPALRLGVRETMEFSVVGPEADRGVVFARRWAQFHGIELPRCRIEIEQTIPSHAGLGSGTQLALGIAAALSSWCGIAEQLPQDLARSVGRGLRSAIGTYGFAFGGLIIEQGKLPEEVVSPLEYRLEMPREWRFLLVRPTNSVGLAGEDESVAFEHLPPVAASVTAELNRLAYGYIVPAVCTGDFRTFSDGIYRYGRLSGECFAARQGGPYNGPLVTQLVERIRVLGIAGVGQSSWGPTVFAATESQAAAKDLERQLFATSTVPLGTIIASPAKHGASIHVDNGERVN